MIKSSFGALSQTTDTICAPVQQMKKVYADALKYRYADSLLKIVEGQLAEKKAQVEILEEKGEEVSANHRKEIINLEGQIGTLKDQVNGFEKMWRREKRRRRLAQAAGIVTTVAAIAVPLFITK